MAVLVDAHGGHPEDFRNKNAIQDALLSYLCQGANGFPCNGHGSCSGGVCTCFQGYSGLKCERNDADMLSFGETGMAGSDIGFGAPDLTGLGVTFRHPTANDVGGINLHDLMSSPMDHAHTISCMPSDENPCSGNGYCQKPGICVCEPGYSGILCELSAEVGFCRTYRDCAECTAFMDPCPDNCTTMANFKLVFGFPKVPTGSTNFRQCRFRSSKLNCTFHFKEESEDDHRYKTIMVKACLASEEGTANMSESVTEIKDTPMQPLPESTQITASVTRTDSDQRTEMASTTVSEQGMDSHEGHIHPHKEDEPTSGNNAGKQSGVGGGASFTKPEVIWVLGCLALAAVCSSKFSKE